MGVRSVSLALGDLVKVNVQRTLAQRNELVDFLRKNLGSKGAVLDHKEVASNTIYFYLRQLTSDIALALFDINGLEISAGSACSSGTARASGILVQTGVGEYAKNGLRISLPLQMNEELLSTIKNRLLQTLSKL